MLLADEERGERCSEEQHGQNDRADEQNFFSAPLRAVDIAFATAEHAAESGSLALQKNRGDQQSR